MGEMNRTFVGPLRVASRTGHVVNLWSDEMELSHAQCHCGWEDFDTDAEAVLAAWRSHHRGEQPTTLDPETVGP